MLLKIIKRSLISILLFVCSYCPAFGQSSIFFVPSTDTQDKRTVMISSEGYFHFDKYRNGGFQVVGPSVTYGLRKDLEIGVNFYYTKEEGSNAFELQPNIKWKVYESKKGDVAVSVGSVVFVPLNKAAGDNIGDALCKCK